MTDSSHAERVVGHSFDIFLACDYPSFEYRGTATPGAGAQKILLLSILDEFDTADEGWKHLILINSNHSGFSAISIKSLSSVPCLVWERFADDITGMMNVPSSIFVLSKYSNFEAKSFSL